MNVSEIIEAFGGYHEAGRLLGVSRSLLSRWEEEGIPPKRWPSIAALSEKYATKALSLEDLAAAAPTKAKAAA